MSKRKLIILCLLAVLCCVLVTSAADEFILSNAANVLEGNTTVKLTIPSYYTVQIPAELPISYGVEATSLTIGVSSMRIGSNKALKIETEAPDGVLLQTGGNGSIPYSFRDGASFFDSAVFTELGEKEISIEIALDDWYSAAAGEYTGTVTFLVSVVNQQEAAK